MKSAVGYAELHTLSNFSFQRGASHAEELMTRAADLGYAALAITDECSLAGIVRAYQATKLEGVGARVKLIVGAEFRFEDGLRLVLLAPHKAAYEQLSALITVGRRAAPKSSYRLQRDDAAALCPDCFALWLPRGDAAADDPRWLEEQTSDAQWLRSQFRDVWLAVELHHHAGERARLRALLAISADCGLRAVAAGDVHYHSRERRALQDVQTALRHRLPVKDCGVRLFPNGERHLRALDELAELYPAELLAESLAIAQRCTFSLSELRYQYPCELVPAGDTPISHLRTLTAQGIGERWPQGIPADIVAQIERELALIDELDYASFFLTVHDIVRFARERGILCQGRGSAANSAVCYALGITAVDPARGTLLFERFLSRERNEPPDIDVDFEHQRREEVIQYIFAKYGRERAALAATVICYRARSALRDVGRALSVAPEDIDRLSRSLAWWDRPEQLGERLQQLGFNPRERTLRLWMGLTRQLIGFPRHLSQHVGGFVISDQPLSALVPVENAAMPDRTVIQWDKDDLEALGLLKVDVLALGMLSAIRRTLDLRNQIRDFPLNLDSIPAEDPATYAMIQRGETLGVFQIESRAQINMITRLKPRTFYDLVIQVAIVRPGPIQGGMVHPYLRRRAGLEAVDYPPRLEKILDRTLGVPIFQEQVMQIAVAAAGFSAGESDQMRRSMAAWKRSGGLEKFENRLKTGMAERGYDAEFAERIYQQILGFGSYGFPESHEPAAFFAALINSQPMGFYPPSMLVREAQRMGVVVHPIDVTVSDWECTLELASVDHSLRTEPAIRLGLRLISGLSEATAQKLILARVQRPFADVADLSARAGLNARARQALAEADALATLAGHRHQARWAAAAEPLPGLLRAADATDTQASLFAPTEGADIVADYRSTGLTLRRHPLALMRARLRKRGMLRSVDLGNLADRCAVRVAGLVMFRQRPQTASGLMFMTLEDETGTVNLIVPAKTLEAQRDVLIGSRLLLVEGQLQNDQGSVHVLLKTAEDCSDWLGALPHLSRDFR